MDKTISVKVPDELADEIEEYKDEDEGTSGAVRRLIREGLKREKTNSIPGSLPHIVLLVSIIFTVGAFGDFDQVLGYLGLAGIAGSIIYDRLDLHRHFP